MKNLCHSVIPLIVLCLLPVVVLCQAPTITTSVDKDKILIGERIGLDVRVRMPDNRYKLTWLTVPSDFGTFILASQDKIDSSYQTGVLDFHQRLHITSFDSGRQMIPSLAFQFETISGDSSFQMFTDSIPIEVMFSPADSTLPFHDIKPVLHVNTERPWWFWPAIVAVILLLSFIGFLIIRKRKKKGSENIFESPLTAYEEAMRLIVGLQKEDLLTRDEFKSFHFRLTDILKRYISRETNENKMHLTGSELIAELSNHEIDKKLFDEIRLSINVSDAVKFAKFRPSVDESENCLKKVSEVINLLHGQKKEDENAL